MSVLAGQGALPEPETGSVTVELVVLAPVLVMVLMFAVACGRLASAQLDVDAAAHAAARAASIARTDAAARADARRVATETLGTACHDPTISVNTGGLQPGGVATVTVTCRVPLSDLGLPLPASRQVSTSASSPIDRWRAGPPQ